MNRILIIGYIPNPNGISTSVMNIYRNLDRSLFQYDFLLSEIHRNNMTEDMKEILTLGGNLYYMDYEKYDFPERSYDDLKSLMLSIPDLKGVHVHDLYRMTAPLRIADGLGFPVKAIHSHVSWGERAAEIKNEPDFKARLDDIRGEQFDRLACSDSAGLFDFDNLPFEIIPNGVDLNRFTFNPVHRSILRRKLGISNSSCVIGTVANLFPSKNPMFALEVFRQFKNINPDSHYFILGSGSMDADVKDYVRRNGLSDCVHIFGAQFEIDVFYSAMDIILHPSKSEGLPNSLVEAQAEGLPCLISDDVSDMVRITPLIHTFSLSCDAGSWAEELQRISISGDSRRSWQSEISAAGYNSKDVAKKIMALYSRRI